MKTRTASKSNPARRVAPKKQTKADSEPQTVFRNFVRLLEKTHAQNARRKPAQEGRA